MKKLISLLLAMTLALSLFAGCTNGNADTTTEPSTEPSTEATTEATVPVDVDLVATIDAIYAEHPVEFAPTTLELDLTDTSEEGLWSIKSYTGLDSTELITGAAVSEAMIGSIPYSLVLVQVADPANARTVAEAMKSGIDQRKWICVEADDLQVSGCGSVVMLVMIGSEYGTAQPFTDAFQTACGAELDFTI